MDGPLPPMCSRRGSVCGRATAPMCCKWTSLASHYRWWEFTDDSLHDCAWAWLGPPAGLLVTGCGVGMGSLAMEMSKNGSGLAPSMGLDGAIWRSSSD